MRRDKAWADSCEVALRIIRTYEREADTPEFYGALAILVALHASAISKSERDVFFRVFAECIDGALHEFGGCDCGVEKPSAGDN